MEWATEGELIFRYGDVQTLHFPLINRGDADLKASAPLVSGDCQISQNEGAFVNTDALPSETGNGTYEFALTGAETSTARIVITVIDQSDPSAFEDQCILIATHANASAQYAWDFDLATNTFDVTQIDGVATSAVSLSELSMIETGLTTGTPTATLIDGDSSFSATDDFYNGMLLLNTSVSALARRILDYTGATKTFRLAEPGFPATPSPADAITVCGLDLESRVGGS